jgi:hypothetical protein
MRVTLHTQSQTMLQWITNTVILMQSQILLNSVTDTITLGLKHYYTRDLSSQKLFIHSQGLFTRHRHCYRLMLGHILWIMVVEGAPTLPYVVSKSGRLRTKFMTRWAKYPIFPDDNLDNAFHFGICTHRDLV